MNTKYFFEKGTPNQYDFILAKYNQALSLKAESKSTKPENIIKLDKWVNIFFSSKFRQWMEITQKSTDLFERR